MPYIRLGEPEHGEGGSARDIEAEALRSFSLTEAVVEARSVRGLDDEVKLLRKQQELAFWQGRD